MATLTRERLLQASLELGWTDYPLVVDNITISQKQNSCWKIHLADDEGSLEKGRLADQYRPIAVLIGDTDHDVPQLPTRM
ncbi:carboxylesterase [Penicillium canescens]|nr:carboxylesterase [Penicillium canescens]KAJ6181373.1 carboxylesterase [Penicillium canescens]